MPSLLAGASMERKGIYGARAIRFGAKAAPAGGLDPARHLLEGAPNKDRAMDNTAPTPANRRVKWQSVSTVLSAAVLIGAEVFGAAFAGGWALANLLGLGDYGEYVLTTLFFIGGVAIMVGFIRKAMRIEPFFATD